MDLTQLCGGTAAQLQPLDLSALMQRCTQFAPAFDPGKDIAALTLGIIFAILAAVAVLIHRLVNQESAVAVVFESLEAALFGAGAGYAGAVGGVIVAQLAPPLALGLVLFALALLALVFAIIAAARGDADAGWKVLGFFHSVVLMAGLVVMGIFCVAVPHGGPAADAYHAYILVVAIGLGIASGISAMYTSVLRGNFYVLGVAILMINGSWGFIGNLLGLMAQFGSLFSYKDFGGEKTGTKRTFFVHYPTGMSLKTDQWGRHFAFTEGAVMTATPDLVKHEGVHVVQHYLLGPIYPLSHALWFVAMVVPGLIGAAIKRIGAGDGVTNMSYYDNPYEIIAYGIMNPGGRDTTQPLIWGWAGSVLTAIIYALAAIAAFVIFLAVRLH